MKQTSLIFIWLCAAFNFAYSSSEKPKKSREQRLRLCWQKCSDAAIKSSEPVYAICYSTRFPNNTNPYCLARYQACLARCTSKFQQKKPPIQPVIPVVTASRYSIDLYP
jgi:hypothetical protein